MYICECIFKAEILGYYANAAIKMCMQVLSWTCIFSLECVCRSVIACFMG